VFLSVYVAVIFFMNLPVIKNIITRKFRSSFCFMSLLHFSPGHLETFPILEALRFDIGNISDY
jgi:hypothetical protein